MSLPQAAFQVFTDANVVGLGNTILPAEQQDLLDMFGWCEGYASRAYDRVTLWKSWLDRYRNRLEKVGCVALERYGRPPRVISSQADFDQHLRSLGDAIAPGPLAGYANEALRRLRLHDYAARFFSSGAKDEHLATFMLTPCARGTDGQLIFAVYALALNASAEERDFDFWTDIQREVVLWTVGTLYRFDPDRYSNFRQQIRDDLQRQAHQFIINLPLN